MRKKLLLTSCLYFFTCGLSLVQAQHLTLDINHVSQTDPDWCWAAVMDMVMSNKYPADAQNQCQIAKYYFGGCSCPSDCAGTPSCSRALTVANMKSIFKSYLNKIAASSIYANFDWRKVKVEIDNNRLFIIGVNQTSKPPCTYTHFVVAKGYSESSTVNFMEVNDPGDQCAGTNIIEVRHNNFLPGANNISAKPCNFIYIKGNTSPNSPNVLHPVVRDTAISLTALRAFKPDNSINSIKKALKSSEIKQLVASGRFRRVPVYYYADVNGIIDSSKNIIDMISTQGKENTVTRMQLINGLWEPLLVLEQKDSPQIPLNVLGKNVLLNNDKTNIDTSLSNVKYEKVIFPPYFYEYYRFSIDGGKSYYYTLAHVDYAQVKDQTIKKGELLRRNDIVKIIKNTAYRSTNNLQKANQRKIDKTNSNNNLNKPKQSTPPLKTNTPKKQ